eukprot:7379761-Prymnesium_polylepis.3
MWGRGRATSSCHQPAISLPSSHHHTTIIPPSSHHHPDVVWDRDAARDSLVRLVGRGRVRGQQRLQCARGRGRLEGCDVPRARALAVLLGRTARPRLEQRAHHAIRGVVGRGQVERDRAHA